MREILYRAKRKDNGEWIEGLPSYGPDGKITELECLKKIPGEDIPEIEYIEIDPETLCQYTGLRDSTKWENLSKNERNKFLSEWNYKENRQNIKGDWRGKKIFEGDMIITTEPPEDKFLTVEWDPDSMKFVLNLNEPTDQIVDFGDCYWGYGVRVIGNIFDNPELIEEVAE